MPRVRPNGAERWATRTAAATPDYQAGVAAPRQQWQSATVAAGPAHKAAMTEALARDAFVKGVQRVGNEKWQRAAQGKGAERFGPGAAAGVQDYQTGVAPYLQVIESISLPPRGPKGDPRNIQRVAVLAAALRKRKTGFALVPVLALAASLCLLALGLWAKGAVRGSAPQTPRDGLRNAEQRPGSERHHSLAVLVLAGSALAAMGCACAALDVVSATATAAAAGGSAMAAVAGDSLTVRNTSLDQTPIILETWVKSQTSGFVQFTHPSGHDQVRDIRMREVAAAVLPLFPYGINEPVEPQELLTCTISGGAVAGDVELLHFLVYYPSLPGIESRLIDLGQLEGRMRRLVTIEDTTTATASSAYSGSRALNAASDLLRANTDYALLGAHIGAVCGALTIRGVDTGNLRIPIPGMSARPEVTAQWFVQLTEEYGLPLIPVLNSANKAGIFIENVQDENLTAVPFSLLLAELSPG